MGTASSVSKPLKSKRLVEKTIKTEKKLEKLDTKHYDKDNLHLLRDMFVGLDPTMRVYMDENRGQVQVSAYYDRRSELLKVKIHQAKEIKSSNIRADTCDAYFKVYLLAQEEGADIDPTVFSTSVAEQTCEAVFDEVFQFDLRITQVSAAILVIELWDFSELIEPGEMLGSVELPTQHMVGKSVTDWYPIQPKKNSQAGGEVRFCVSYDLESSMLKLGNLRTENLLVGDNLCVMCRVLLTRKDKFFETVENPVFDKTCCWEEEFSFKVPKDDLERSPANNAVRGLRPFAQKEMSFLITVFSVNGKGDRKPLGQAIAPLTNFDLKKKVAYKRKLEDLTSQYKENRKNLAYASVLHELRDAYLAHTVAKAPQAIFSGALLQQNKWVRLSCRKAGCNSKVVLFNGNLCPS